jgi:subtilisin
MRLRWTIVAALAAMLTLPAPSVAETPVPTIVVYRDGRGGAAHTRSEARRLGFTTTHRFGYALQGFAARLTDSQAAALRQDGAVAFIEEDRPVHAVSTALAVGDSIPVGIRRVGAAGDSSVNPPSGVAVAVIDTGIDLANPDLNAVPGVNCVDSAAPPADDNGHGTHVSGTIAARNDGEGVVGVAPGTLVYAVKVLDSTGSGSTASVLCGVDWVTAHAASLGIKVANMSLGGPVMAAVGGCESDAERLAICRSTNAGVTYVVAAGNNNGPFDGRTPFVPAAYPEVLTVTAMADGDGLPGGLGGPVQCSAGGGVDDAIASFSNYATTPEDKTHTIAAPGVCINSLKPGGGTAVMSGTSMAAPHVAGEVATCIDSGGVPGPCSGQAPAAVIDTIRSAAQSHAVPGNGFTGDPLHPGTGYRGYLLWAGAGPGAITGSAGVPAETGATPGGSVVTNGVTETTWRFDYGTSTAYSLATAETPAADGPVSAPLSGLLPGTTYHYRLVVSGGGWVARGVDRTFTTAGVTPPDTSVDGGPAGIVSAQSATFTFSATGSVDHFECRIDSGAWDACTSPATYSSLGEGAHDFSVRAVNASGPDAAPAARHWTVDLTPPDTGITSGPPPTTSAASAAFVATANELGSGFRCRLDGSTWQQCSQQPTYAGLSVGTHQFDIAAVDAAGNEDPTPATWQWEITPFVSIATPAPALVEQLPVAGLPAPGAKARRPSRIVLDSRPVQLSRGRGVRLRVRCAGGNTTCTGRVELRLRAAGGRRLAVRRVQLAPLAATVLHLRLDSAAARVLRATGKLRVVVALGSRTGRPFAALTLRP